ncbi:YIP1 family protein [Bacillus zanthoxyli]
MKSVEVDSKKNYFPELIERISYLFRILHSPVEVFSKIMNKKIGVVPMLIFLFIYFMCSLLLTHTLTNNSKEMVQLLKDAPSESLKTVVVIFTSFIQSIGFLINILISSIIYKFLMFIFKIKIPLKDMIKIVFISQIPTIFLLVTKILSIQYTDIDPLIPITSLGYTVSLLETNDLIVKFFSKIEFFGIWSLYLVSLGISIFSNNRLRNILVPVVIITILYNYIADIL